MSKRIAHIVTLCLLYIGACAQPRLSPPELYLGVHGGVIASTVIFNPVVRNMDPIYNACLLSGNGGIVFRWNSHKNCGLQVELNYLPRGWQEINTNGRYIHKLHYVEMPIMSHIFFGKTRGRGFINLGPQIGYCVWDEGGVGDQLTPGGKQYDPIEKRFDWGVTLGIGGGYRSKKVGTWEMEARASYSLGTLFGNRTTDYFKGMSSPLELSINLAWLWEFKKKTISNKQ